MEQNDDICGLHGADKIPHPCHWPGEAVPCNNLVHFNCEQEECERAYYEFYKKAGENGVRDFVHNC